jgi:hypothetical protein
MFNVRFTAAAAATHTTNHRPLMKTLSRLASFLCSLRLTVVCLGLALVLVFAGTLAQVNLGLYETQRHYFQSLFVWWTPPGAGFALPVWPGGYLLGAVLLANLLAAHAKRFQLRWRKLGLLFIHSGLILLLAGQLAIDTLQVESAMRLSEGETLNYSESPRLCELVFINRTDPQSDRVFAIAESKFQRLEGLSKLPLRVRLREYYPNSRLQAVEPPHSAPISASSSASAAASASQGFGRNWRIVSAPRTTSMDERDVPSAVVEIFDGVNSLGTWLLSCFVEELQEVRIGSQSWHMALRFERYYKPFSIQLLDFRHDKYAGTDTPKNFSSRIRLRNDRTREDREVLIYMNNPLRYGGETFYQGSFDPKDDRVTILHVVRNPGWLVPYLSCALTGAGLLVQFLTHLILFLRKR